MLTPMGGGAAGGGGGGGGAGGGGWVGGRGSGRRAREVSDRAGLCYLRALESRGQVGRVGQPAGGGEDTTRSAQEPRGPRRLRGCPTPSRLERHRPGSRPPNELLDNVPAV